MAGGPMTYFQFKFRNLFSGSRVPYRVTVGTFAWSEQEAREICAASLKDGWEFDEVVSIRDSAR